MAEELAWAEGQGIHREITHVWYGQGEDAILLWEEGMDLPAATAADEALWGYEPGAPTTGRSGPGRAQSPEGFAAEDFADREKPPGRGIPRRAVCMR